MSRALRILRQLLLFPLIVLDVIGNVIVGESWRNTLSASAHTHKNRKYWGWSEGAIDAFFFWQIRHCKAQAEREARHGSVWASWWHNLISTIEPRKEGQPNV